MLTNTGMLVLRITGTWLAGVNHLAEQTEEAQKSSYNLEFRSNRQQLKKRKLEDQLIDRLHGFILELGCSFCFIGRQHRSLRDAATAAP